MRPIAIAALLLFTAAAQAKEAQPQAVRGTLTADGTAVAEGQTLRWGQTLATRSDPAIVKLPGIAAFRMGPRTSLRLVRTKTGGVRVFLDGGGLLSAVKKGNQYEVRTAVAAAAVRGTVFHMQVVSEEKTYACLCEGRYDLTAGRAPAREISSKEHTASYASAGALDQAAMLYHDDDEIADLKELLKRKK